MKKAAIKCFLAAIFVSALFGFFLSIYMMAAQPEPIDIEAKERMRIELEKLKYA